MADWRLPSNMNVNSVYDRVGPSSSTNNTKGSWKEVIPSTEFDAILSVTIITGSYAGDHREMFDVGIGAAGSEVAIIENIYISAKYHGIGHNILLPIIIPAGSRISIRRQANTGTSSSRCWITPIATTFTYQSLQVCDTIGAVTAATTGTLIDPGGTADTYGNWVELSSAAEKNYSQIIMAVGGYTDLSRTDWHYWYIDIGIGDTPADNIIANSIFCCAQTYYSLPYPNIFNLPLSIPKGEKISVRSKCSSNTSGNRYIDVILYCFA